MAHKISLFTLLNMLNINDNLLLQKLSAFYNLNVKEISVISTVLDSITLSAFNDKNDNLSCYQIFINGNPRGSIINVPNSITSAFFDDDNKKLSFTDTRGSGFALDLSSLVDRYVAGNGITLKDSIETNGVGQEISIARDESSENYLYLNEDGIGISGLNDLFYELSTDIEASASALNARIDVVIEDFDGKIEYLSGSIDQTNEDLATTSTSIVGMIDALSADYEAADRMLSGKIVELSSDLSSTSSYLATRITEEKNSLSTEFVSKLSSESTERETIDRTLSSAIASTSSFLSGKIDVNKTSVSYLSSVIDSENARINAVSSDLALASGSLSTRITDLSTGFNSHKTDTRIHIPSAGNSSQYLSYENNQPKWKETSGIFNDGMLQSLSTDIVSIAASGVQLSFNDDYKLTITLKAKNGSEMNRSTVDLSDLAPKVDLHALSAEFIESDQIVKLTVGDTEDENTIEVLSCSLSSLVGVKDALLENISGQLINIISSTSGTMSGMIHYISGAAATKEELSTASGNLKELILDLSSDIVSTDDFKELSGKTDMLSSHTSGVFDYTVVNNISSIVHPDEEIPTVNLLSSIICGIPTSDVSSNGNISITGYYSPKDENGITTGAFYTTRTISSEKIDFSDAVYSETSSPLYEGCPSSIYLDFGDNSEYSGQYEIFVPSDNYDYVDGNEYFNEYSDLLSLRHYLTGKYDVPDESATMYTYCYKNDKKKIYFMSFFNANLEPKKSTLCILFIDENENDKNYCLSSANVYDCILSTISYHVVGDNYIFHEDFLHSESPLSTFMIGCSKNEDRNSTTLSGHLLSSAFTGDTNQYWYTFKNNENEAVLSCRYFPGKVSNAVKTETTETVIEITSYSYDVNDKIAPSTNVIFLNMNDPEDIGSWVYNKDLGKFVCIYEKATNSIILEDDLNALLANVAELKNIYGID